ncbi:uncharacterized protein OCT59_011979 [Rhizophagus irregularis]|uniref:Uncharacterized protein n=1 Tax=Rhizophagus irregularis (strain DAOM 197198w) TaxID=1432141 RepID=A0A015K297_RHIIW|nr:hypothetical protein RirG_242940 [Rhizophagus irregularis DAOM 197198w]UZO00864.1 hypothetical protein OCT59_011979 [Rhizophagus irregularis]GBC39760.1 hypothetical protein GLOIN_2v1763159 [Rhizophagus irregularis DAOM 181602=DAOM 197198]
MEDKRNIQIAENKFPLIEGTEQQNFLRTTYINYLNFSEGLAAQFFTGRNIEVQCNILRNNFSLTDEDINSWRSRASRYQMTPESFAFFLHTAIYSAVESYAAVKRLTADRRNMLATSIAEHVTSMDLKQQKIEKEIQKAKKHYSERSPKKEKSKTGIKHRSKKDKKKKKKAQRHDSDSDFTYQYGSDSDDLLD